MKNLVFLLTLLPAYSSANGDQQHRYQRLTDVIATRGINNTNALAALHTAGIPEAPDSDEEDVYVRNNHSNDNQTDLYDKQQPRIICVLALGGCAFIGYMSYYFYHLVHQHKEN